MPPPAAGGTAAASYSPAAAPRSRLAAAAVAAPSLPPAALTPHDLYSIGQQQAGDAAPGPHPSRRSMHAHSKSEVGGADAGVGASGSEGIDAFVTHATATPLMPISRTRRNSIDMESQAPLIHGGSRSGQSSPSILSSSPVHAASSMLLRTDESKLLSPLGSSQAGSLKSSGVPTHPTQLPRAQSTTLHGSSKSIGGSIDAFDWFRDAPQPPPPHAHARSLSRRSLGGSNDFSVSASLLPSLISAVPAVAASSKPLVPRKSSMSSADESSSVSGGAEQNSTPAIHNSSRARIGHTRTMSRTQPPSPKLSPRATPTPLQSALALDDGEGKLSSPQKDHGASIHMRSFNNSRASSPACSMPTTLPPITGSQSSCSSPAPLSRRMSPAVGELQAAIVNSAAVTAATPRLSFGSSNNARLRKPLALSVYDFSPAGEIPSGGGGSGSASSACASPVPHSASKATMSPTGLSGTPLFYTNRSPQQVANLSSAAAPAQPSAAATAPSGLAKVTRAFSGVRASLQGSMSGPVSSNASLNSSPNVTPKLGSRNLARLDRPNSMNATPEAASAAATSAPNSGASSASSTASPSPAMFGGGGSSGGRITGGAQASLFGGSPSSVSRRISPVKVNLGAAPMMGFQSSTSTSPVSSHPVSPTKTISFASAMMPGRGHLLSAPLGDRVAIGGGGGGSSSSRNSLSPLARSPTTSPLSSSQQTPEQQHRTPAESVPSSPMHLLSLAALSSKQTMPMGLPPTPPPPSDVAARASPPPSAAAVPQPFAVASSDRPSPARLRFLPPPISLPVLTACGTEGEQHELTPSSDSPNTARSLQDEDIEAAMAKVARKAQQAAEDEARFAAAAAAAAAEAAAEADEIDTQQSPSPICSPVDDGASASSVSLPFELPPVFVQASRCGAAVESPSPSPRRKPSTDGQPPKPLMRRVRSDDEECERALLREVQAATLAASQAASPINPANPVALPGFESGETALPESAPFTLVLPDAPRASFHNYARSSLDEAALSSPGSSSSGGSLAVLPQPPRSPPHSRPASAQGLVIQLTRPDSMNARRLHSSSPNGGNDRERDPSSASASADASADDPSPFHRPRSSSFGGGDVSSFDGDVAEEEEEAEDDAADFWDAMDSGAMRFF